MINDPDAALPLSTATIGAVNADLAAILPHIQQDQKPVVLLRLEATDTELKVTKKNMPGAIKAITDQHPLAQIVFDMTEFVVMPAVVLVDRVLAFTKAAAGSQVSGSHSDPHQLMVHLGVDQSSSHVHVYLDDLEHIKGHSQEPSWMSVCGLGTR